MWILLVTLSWMSSAEAGVRGNQACATHRTSNRVRCMAVLNYCLETARCQKDVHWTSCYEKKIPNCLQGRLENPLPPDFKQGLKNTSVEAKVSPGTMHRVHIPASALQKGKQHDSETEVMVVATLINSTFFQSTASRHIIPRHGQMHGTVMGELVLAVHVGSQPLTNLTQPIKLIFTHNKRRENRTCVYWKVSGYDRGYWSTHGCNTSVTGSEVICHCDHLSFFAVLVNPMLSVDKSDSTALSYITYVGSSLSVVFAVASLIVYARLQRRRPEKAIGVHMQLTAALLCLHLGFLLCCLWVWKFGEGEEGWVYRFLGLFLHWALLAMICWTMLEGLHLYLLLVRVFNIYFRRYLLKLSLVGWGLPTLVAVICGCLGVYGKYRLIVIDGADHNSTAEICWIRNDSLEGLVVMYITTVAFPCVVILCNTGMLGLVVFKLWHVRVRGGDVQGTGGRKNLHPEEGKRLLRNSATVLGLSCVLGLPWALGSATYISISGIYAFTILNSLQGVFMFLWSMALTCKSQSEDNSSSRDPSSQKITVLNN